MTMPHDRNDASVTFDELFGCLGHPTRRRVVSALVEKEPRDADAFDPPASVQPDVFTQTLYHNHLPRLDAAEFVDWERDAAVVRRGPRFDAVQGFLAVITENENRLPASWP